MRSPVASKDFTRSLSRDHRHFGVLHRELAAHCRGDVAGPAAAFTANPFDSSAVPDFNIWFIAMAICTRIYSTMAMQQKQGSTPPPAPRMNRAWRGAGRMAKLCAESDAAGAGNLRDDVLTILFCTTCSAMQAA